MGSTAGSCGVLVIIRNMDLCSRGHGSLRDEISSIRVLVIAGTITGLRSAVHAPP
jgi:hypothetical protein